MNSISSEISFRTARSGGSGGQNVNKVETQAEALWDIAASRFFSDEEKALIAERLKNRLNKDGLLSVKCSETRSQLENKEIAVRKLEDLVARSLVKPKKRTATRPTAASKEKRIEQKKREGQKKEMRRPPPAE